MVRSGATYATTIPPSPHKVRYTTMYVMGGNITKIVVHYMTTLIPTVVGVCHVKALRRYLLHPLGQYEDKLVCGVRL